MVFCDIVVVVKVHKIKCIGLPIDRQRCCNKKQAHQNIMRFVEMGIFKKSFFGHDWITVCTFYRIYALYYQGSLPFLKRDPSKQGPLTSYGKTTLKYSSNIIKIQPDSGNFMGVTVWITEIDQMIDSQFMMIKTSQIWPGRVFKRRSYSISAQIF